MSDKETAKDVIDSLHRRQQLSQRAPALLGIAALLLVIGAAVIILWLLAPDKLAFFSRATETPTPTATATATSTATALPTPSDTPTPGQPTETPTATVTETPSGPSVYVVQEGDTLGTIATKFNTDLATLLALNPQIDPTTLIIRLGDQIIIPGPNTQLPTPTNLPTGLAAGTVIDYRIVSGDSLEAIASRFNSTVQEILKLNPTIKNANDIKVGEVIKVPVNIATPLPSPTVGTQFPTIVPPATRTPTLTNTPLP